MLKKITIKNFKSFKEETIFDLNATGYKVLEDTNTYEGALKGLLFVGANASGKTNSIKSLKFLLELLFAEKKIDLIANRCLFSKEMSFSLKYEFEIMKSKIEYYIEYGVTENLFVEKLLVEKLLVNDEILIDRIGNCATSKITENEIYTDLVDDSLLLREIYFNTKFRKNELLRKWFDFLTSSIFLDGYTGEVFSPGKNNVELIGYLEKNGVNKINEFFQKYNFQQEVEFSKESKGDILRVKSDEKAIFFKRKGLGEPIPFDLESLGNKKLLTFLPALFHVIENGGMLIIDEFSSGLHNFLEELLLKYFMEKSSNAQLFLVSHSTNLLSNSLFRPDQIYSISFNGDSGSQIKQFSSEQPRVAQNLEKMYTSGIFGGVPNFTDED